MSGYVKKLGVWGWWLIYVLFVTYGSLIPFQFKNKIPHDTLEALASLLAAYSPGAHISGVDVLANFALYIPLGFLSVLLILKNKGGIFPAFISSIAFGIFLSLSIEICQAYFSDRTSSIIDISVNTAGTATGAFMAGVFPLLFPQTRQNARFYTALLREKPVFFITVLYGSLIFFGALVPFDISIQPSDLWVTLKQAEWLPFTSSPINYPNLVSELLFYGFFAGLCYFSLRLYKRSGSNPGPSSIIMTTALGFAVEFGQLFIASRFTKISDILIAALGGVVGVVMSSMLTKSLFSRDFQTYPESIENDRYRFFYTKLILVLGYYLVIAYLLLAPLQFELGWHKAVGNFTWRSLVPFYAYWSKMNAWAAYDLIFTCLLFVPLGALGAYCFRPFPINRTITLILALLLSIGVEFLQLFEPGRCPDITDVISASGGTLIGIWMVQKLSVNVDGNRQDLH